MDKEKFLQIKLLSPQIESEIIKRIRELPFSSLWSNPPRPGGDTEIENVVAPPPGIRVLYVNRELTDDNLAKGYGGADFNDLKEDAPGTDSPVGYPELMKVFENIPAQHGEDIENKVDYSELDTVLKTVLDNVEKVKKDLTETLINVLSSVYDKVKPVSSAKELVRKAVYLQKYAEVTDEEIDILTKASSKDLEYAFSLIKKAQEGEAAAAEGENAPAPEAGGGLGAELPFGGLPGLGMPGPGLAPLPTEPQVEEQEPKKFPTNAIEIPKELAIEEEDIEEFRSAVEKLNDDPLAVSDEYLIEVFTDLVEKLKEEKEKEEEEEEEEEKTAAVDENREKTFVIRIEENVFDFIKDRLGYLEYSNARNAISHVNSSLSSKDYDKAIYYFSRFCDILEKAKKEPPIKTVTELVSEEEDSTIDFFSLTSSLRRITAKNENLYYVNKVISDLFKILKAIPDNVNVIKRDGAYLEFSVTYELPNIKKPAGVVPVIPVHFIVAYDAIKETPIGIIYKSSVYPFDSATIRDILVREYGGKVEFGIGVSYGRRKETQK